MRKFFLLCIIWLLVISSSIYAEPIDKILFITEQYPPFNYEENGKITGIATDVLEKILEDLGSKQRAKDIKVLPWARGYKYAQKNPNTCLFSTTRTEARENLFKWVGPISSNRNVLIAKKSKKLKIKSDEDLKGLQIGVIWDDIAEIRLVEKGMNIDAIQKTSETKSNITKLKRDRIDAWGYSEMVAFWELKSQGINASEYEVIYVLDESFLYFAFHKDTPDATIKKIQLALDKLKSNGTYAKIFKKYTKQLQ